MELVAPCGPVYQAGTLSGNPLSMAAGLATLKALRDRPAGGSAKEETIYGYLEGLGGRLEAGLSTAAEKAGVPVQVQRAGSMITAFFNEEPVVDLESAKRSDTARFSRFFHAMLHESVYWPPSQYEAAMISAAHTEQDIDHLVDMAVRALERMD